MEQKSEQPSLKAFVLMPFDPEFDKIFNDLIKPALEEVGYDVNRADDILSQQNILKDIVRGIAEADLVVADLTTVNPNVFYELGISHTMQRPTVLLTQSIEDVPFDLKSYRVIQYSVRFDEAPRLSQTLKELGEKAKSGKLGFGNPVADFIPQMTGVEFPPATKGEKAKVEVEGKREVETEKEEKGLWDFVVDGEESAKGIAETMERIAKAMQEIAEKAQRRTTEVQEITQSRGPGTASQIHKLTTIMAADMIQHTEKLEEEQPKLHGAWESFDENFTGLVQTMRIRTEEDKEAVLKFRSEVDKIWSGIRNLLEVMQAYQDTIVGMRGISRDINRASKRMARILDLLISDLEGADSYCAKVLTLLDEKIEEG